MLEKKTKLKIQNSLLRNEISSVFETLKKFNCSEAVLDKMYKGVRKRIKKGKRIASEKDVFIRADSAVICFSFKHSDSPTNIKFNKTELR